MVRAPYIDKNGLKKGAWSKEEDDKLKAYIQRYGHWNWRQLPKFAGLQRCGKSCRIRWMNYLRPDVKRGGYSKAEDDLIVELREKLGSKWAKIAEQLPGRTDNEIKNHWHTSLKKRERENRGTPIQELEEKTIESFQIGVDIPDVLETEAEKTTTTVINPSHPVILESSPFSPTTSSTESSSDSTLVDVLFDGDELQQKSGPWSEEEDDRLRACIRRHGLSSGRTEWNEQPSEIYQSITEASSDSTEQRTMESRNLLTISTPADPMLDGFPLTPETTSSSTEFSFFSSDLNMVDTMTSMEYWFAEESSNPFETFESDFWTEPYVLDTASTKCCYPSWLVDWQFAI